MAWRSMALPVQAVSGVSIASAEHQATVKAVHGDGLLRCQDAQLHAIGSLVPKSLGVERIEDMTIYLVDGDRRFDELLDAYPWATVVSPKGGKKRGRKPGATADATGVDEPIEEPT